MTDLCTAWRARHPALDSAQPTPEHDKIAADLPPDAQRAMTDGPAWDLTLTPVIEAQLELFDLLDIHDRKSLSDKGIAVLRAIWAWDSDYSRREAEYAAWFDNHYRAALRPSEPGHAAAHAACYMDPEAHEPLMDIAGQRQPIAVRHRDDLQVADYLERRGLALTMTTRNGHLVTATQLGRDAAALLRTAQRHREKLFEGARQSVAQAEMDHQMMVGTDKLTRFVGGLLAA